MAIRHFEVELKVEGLVHIGNGNEYGKKDYFPNGSSLSILDAPKFVSMLTEGQLKDYCEFLQVSDSRQGLQDFFRERSELRDIAKRCVSYSVGNAFTPNLAKSRSGKNQFFSVKEFVKDARGCPYVPGSSVKGMLRTAILSSLIQNDASKYNGLYDPSLARKGKKNACSGIERHAFWLEHPDKSNGEVVIDVMRYVSVSDSEPLSTEDLVFAKKYDKFSKDDEGRHKKDMGRISDGSYYEGNELNIYRECLKPGTRISLTVDVDDRIDAYLSGCMDERGFEKVLEQFYGLYKNSFLSHFEIGEADSADGSPSGGDGRCQYVMQGGPLAGQRCRNRAIEGIGYCNTHKDQATTNSAGGTASSSSGCTCLIGGGVDFDSKTIVNALFSSDRERVNEISRILYGQFPTKIDRNLHGGLWRDVEEEGFRPEAMRVRCKKNGAIAKAKDDHRHWQDSDLGVSPHTLKFGIVDGKKYPMGKCAFSIKEA